MITEYLQKGIKEFYLMASCDDLSDSAVSKVKVESYNESYAVIKTPQNTLEKVPISELILIDELSESGPRDLLLLTSLNECSLLKSLESRYNNSLFYSSLGKLMIQVRGQHPSKISSSDEEIFNFSTKLLKKVKVSSQSVVFVGESGSGKTRLFSKLFKCIFSYNHQVKLLKAAWFLIKAFTCQADNGKCGESRFVLNVRAYESEGILERCIFEGFCIDKNLIFKRKTKNFAAFYMIAFDSDDEELSILGKQLNKLNLLLDFGKKDEKMILKFKKSFEILGMTEKFKEIQRLLFGILCLANLEFQENGKNAILKKESSVYLKFASKILGTSEESLQKDLMSFSRTVGKQVVQSKLDVFECESRRNNLMKFLYFQLFDWIVEKINEKLGKEAKGNFISLVDYPGSNVKDQNCLEEFLINYTNEKFHQFCISRYFKHPIDPKLNLTNNLPILELLENPSTGILKALKESCKDSLSVDFFSLVRSSHVFNEYFESSFNEFSVHHIFHKVTYNPCNFRKDNQNLMNTSLQLLLNSSKSPFIRLISNSDQVSKEFNSEALEKFLSYLFELITPTKVRFFYCLNPFISSCFNEKYFLAQVQNFSLIDFIVQFKSIMRNSYTCPEFFKKYRMVLNTNLTTEKNIEILCEKLGFRKDHFSINNRKVLISKSSEKILNSFLGRTLKKAATAILVIQRFCRKKIGLQRFRRFLRAVVRIQAIFRGRREFLSFCYLKNNAMIIQKWYRELTASKLTKLQNLGVTVFSIYLQVKLKSLRINKQTKLALVSQKLWKAHKTRKRLQSRLVVFNILNSVFNNSWKQISLLIQNSSALKIQKRFRGFQVRKALPATLRLFLSHSARKSMILIQKNIKSFLISSKYQRLRKSCKFIQAFWRFNFHCRQMKLFSKSILVIQRRVRIFLLRIRQIKRLLTSFLITESSLLQNLRYLEHSHLFSTSYPITGLRDSRLEILSQISQSSGNLARLKLVTRGSLSPTSKVVNSFKLEKMTFFLRVAHMTILGDLSVVYQNTWAGVLEKVIQECLDKEDVLMDVKLAECHSLALTSRGRVLAWGWNDKGQCLGNAHNGRFLKEIKDVRVLQVECGDDHALTLSEDGEVYAFGDNSKGQLGVGHYSLVTNPVKLELPLVKTIASKGCMNLVISNMGQAFVWPFEDASGQKTSIPTVLIPHIQIIEVSLGFNFALLLTDSGNVYSFGVNTSGQLGLGNTSFHSQPQLLNHLINEKISGVSAGLNHSLARSSLGRLFVWGGNHRGQLGIPSKSSKLKPVHLSLSNKVIQVSAGNSISLLIQETRKVFISGEGNSRFEELSINDCLPEFSDPKKFAVVRARCEWNRAANLILFTFCDLRAVHISHVKAQNAVGLLTARWGKSIEPPIVETLASFYSVVAWRRSPLRNV